MEIAGSEIKALFLVFYEVLKFSKGYSITDDVKKLFRCSKLLEDLCLKIRSLNAEEEFENKLKDFWKVKGLNNFPLMYFQNASHLVLARYMTDSSFKDSEVKLAVKEFILIKSEKVFTDVVLKLRSTQQSVEHLNYMVNNSKRNLSTYKTVLFIEECKKLLIVSEGNVEAVSSSIAQNVSDNEENFKILLNALCLPNDNDELLLNVQELVLLNVCNILSSCESWSFYSYILDINDTEFNHLVNQWSSFTDTIVEALESSIKRLKCDYSVSPFSWQYVGAEKGIPFEVIILLINKAKVIPGVGDRLKQLLINFKKESFRVIAEDVLRKCKIN